MADMNERFGNNLKMIRQGREYSQKCVAEKMGVAVSTYANWEQGRRCPSVGDIYKLIEVLELDANELFQ